MSLTFTLKSVPEGITETAIDLLCPKKKKKIKQTKTKTLALVLKL